MRADIWRPPAGRRRGPAELERAVPLLLALVLASGLCRAALTGDTETTHCLMDIDSYLDGLGLSYDVEVAAPAESAGSDSEDEQLLTAQVVSALEEARRLLRGGGGAGRDSIYWPLLAGGCEPARLLAVINNILAAFDDCEQVSLDYLIILTNFQLGADGEERLVNRIARRRVQVCWREFVASVSRQIDRKMLKMGQPVFCLLETLAESWSGPPDDERTGVRRASPGLITIDEDKALRRAAREEGDDEDERPAELCSQPSSFDRSAEQPARFQSAIGALRAVDFAGDQKVRRFALTLSRLFAKTPRGGLAPGERRRQLHEFFATFFVAPCAELVERVRSIVVLGDIYRRHIAQTLGAALAGEKRSNPRLDYELQIYRICKLGLSRAGAIGEALDGMS